MLQPVVEDNRKIMVAQILVDPFEKVIPFRLVNMEDHPEQLKRNYLVGELHPVTDITQFDDIQNSTKPLDDNTKNICKLHNLKMNINLTDEPVCIPDEWNSTIRNCKAENSWEMNDKCRNEAEIPALPDHLKDLFERSSKNIANEETKRKLADMLIKNSKAFAGSKTDVGTCSFIKHRIDTAGAAPVRQPLRRTPIGFENEEFENLQDQLKTGGNLDSSCTECIEWKQEWSEFRKKVDNVKNLTDKPMIRNVTQSSDGNCSSWLTKYTEKEMSTFQKEDPDYSFLHKWMDAEETPDR
ncbi:Hypothetical predicted protein [Mytilus galloprovincialis]|uniref:Uncharacterized protein n=1 Tax=Mytilus galloprovincialis TaxID=29158 RepID=A0A8B6G196_MYTGA|nr:Hypothetical predicted protein [Mytilus galloprovincialis]